MLKNYFKIALRSLFRHKLFSFINILGLATGMAACLLITLYIKDELSFDQFHANKNRIYRLEGFYERGGQIMEPGATSNFGIAPLLQSSFPEIETYVRMNVGRGTVKQNDKLYREDRICYADSTFFKIFSFPLSSGNAVHALDAPNTVVITNVLAKKYFGTENVLGQLLEVDGNLLKVTGVINEMPANSHFHADLIISVRTIAATFPAWMNTPGTCGTSHYTYLLLPVHYKAGTLEGQLDNFIRTRIGKDHNKYMRLALQPLTKIHLYTHTADQLEAGGDITYIYIFGAVALVILLIACINYINLATARAIERAKEIGLRKVTGASRPQLVVQFLGESVLITLPALLLAYSFAFISIPLFSALSGRPLQTDLAGSPATLLGMAVFLVFVGFLAGIYPAFFISSFKVTRVLKGNGSLSDTSSMLLRKGLVVLQFCISIVMIISTLLIYSQVQFIRSKKLGINTGQLMTVELTGGTSEKFTTLKNELLQNSNILAITSANNDLTSGGTNWRQYQWKQNTKNDVNIATMDVDPDFFTALGIQLVSGRGFSKDRPGDVQDAYVINETAAEFLNLQDPVNEALMGSLFNGKEASDKKGKIIGVVKDFHFASLRQAIKPVVFNLQSTQTDRPAYMWLKISGSNVPAAINFLQATWKKFESESPLTYSFLDEDISNLYTAEENFLNLFVVFSSLAIFIACLGIFGLASYTSTRRFKEIGIRKTLGASVSSIVLLLSKDFTKLVVISFIVAIPLAWYMMTQWLQNYAYRISIGMSVFILAGGLTLFIAWLTVSYQSIKAALTNPVKSLRSE